MAAKRGRMKHSAGMCILIGYPSPSSQPLGGIITLIDGAIALQYSCLIKHHCVVYPENSGMKVLKMNSIV